MARKAVVGAGVVMRGLASRFVDAFERHGERPALEIDGRELSYAGLYRTASNLAGMLEEISASSDPPLTAVFGHRSELAFAGILAALLRGHGYVPLNPAFPAERSARMLERSGCRDVIVDGNAMSELEAVLANVSRPLVLVLPAASPAAELRARWPMHRFEIVRSDDALPAFVPRAVSADALAYLLFTSGSTGDPKGVMVSQANVGHVVDAMVERYGVRESDRFSQMFDLTFDLSAFDIFVAWQRGACVCVPSQKTKLVPASFINESRLTIWFSVPSTGMLLAKLRKLKPDAFPNLRVSLFCGEALPIEVARAWAGAAPNSIVENLYGPTELTIACTLYRWDADRSPGECEQGVVPIGAPFPEMEVLVADESQVEVAPGEIGELLMTGPQLSLGYWHDAERTRAAFVVPPGRDRVFYRTGDRVRRPNRDEPLVYLGRIDNQIKIQGYRVELGEIEAALREEAGIDAAIAVGWPRNAGGADGVVAFLGADELDLDPILERLKARLPSYMVPRELRLVSVFPLNANGKIDRGALLATLASESSS